MSKIIGIDDAGRGPVIGPMVLAGVIAEKKDSSIFLEWGAKDSKMLSPQKRANIKEKIDLRYISHLEIATPKEIDESTNLNYLEAIHTAKIINILTENCEEKVTVIIDCPSVNIKSWTADVQKLVKKPHLITLQCEHKADVNHPIVSAASIIAKEKRESEVKRLKKEFGIDFGSGYPADPKTKEFIAKQVTNKKYQEIIRFSWKTVKNAIHKTAQQSLY